MFMQVNLLMNLCFMVSVFNFVYNFILFMSQQQQEQVQEEKVKISWRNRGIKRPPKIIVLLKADDICTYVCVVAVKLK